MKTVWSKNVQTQWMIKQSFGKVDFFLLFVGKKPYLSVCILHFPPFFDQDTLFSILADDRSCASTADAFRGPTDKGLLSYLSLPHGAYKAKIDILEMVLVRIRLVFDLLDLLYM